MSWIPCWQRCIVQPAPTGGESQHSRVWPKACNGAAAGRLYCHPQLRQDSLVCSTRPPKSCRLRWMSSKNHFHLTIHACGWRSNALPWWHAVRKLLWKYGLTLCVCWGWIDRTARLHCSASYWCRNSPLRSSRRRRIPCSHGAAKVLLESCLRSGESCLFRLAK